MKVTLMFLAVLMCGLVRADSTVDPALNYAYAANAGWINAYANGTNGAVIGQSFCSGCLYGANIDWITLGDGTPNNGYAYGNTDGADSGVNHDGAGRLRGLAWSASAGWLVFEDTGDPRVNLSTGELSGYAWGANLGWVNLSGVCTLVLHAGADSDGDGIPDPWEYRQGGSLRVLRGAGHDADGDGVSDVEEYGADTDPLDKTSRLAFTEFFNFGAMCRLTWTVRPTRLYDLWQTPELGAGAFWSQSALGVMIPDPGTTMSRDVSTSSPLAPVSAPRMFYQVKAVLPLAE